MIASASMLVAPAKEAGMKVPSNADDFNLEKFPHFAVFCNVQLGSPMPSWTAHWTNAKIIAAIPEADIREVTDQQLRDLGIEIGYPMP